MDPLETLRSALLSAWKGLDDGSRQATAYQTLTALEALEAQAPQSGARSGSAPTPRK